MKDTFLMIDGNSLLHRAFHALPLMDAGGVYTNAIYGFLNHDAQSDFRRKRPLSRGLLR